MIDMGVVVLFLLMLNVECEHCGYKIIMKDFGLHWSVGSVTR